MKLITFGTVAFTLCVLGFFLHAATAGRARATFRCVHEGTGEVIDLQLRRDLVAHTALGIVVSPDAGRPFVASSCTEVRP